MNWKLITGVFEGCVIEGDTRILDIPFEEMDDDLQQYIVDFGKKHHPSLNDMESLTEYYEQSWESEETEEEVDIYPLSTQE